MPFASLRILQQLLLTLNCIMLLYRSPVGKLHATLSSGGDWHLVVLFVVDSVLATSRSQRARFALLRQLEQLLMLLSCISLFNWYPGSELHATLSSGGSLASRCIVCCGFILFAASGLCVVAPPRAALAGSNLHFSILSISVSRW